MTPPDEMSSAVRIKDVAAHLGLSTMSVSFALRGLPGVSESTRKRVIACAKKLGYRADPALAALAAYRQRQRKPTGFTQMAFVTNFPTPDEWRHNFIHFFYDGAEQRAKEFGYELVHYWLRENNCTQRRASSILYNRGIKGLIIAPLILGSSHLNLTWKYFSPVAIGYSLAKPMLNYVAFDHHSAVQTVFHKLRAKGYKRIGFVSNHRSSTRIRHVALDAYLGNQFRYNQGPSIPPILPTKHSISLFAEWFYKHRPDAIIASPRWFALLLKERQVPRDFGLAAYSRRVEEESKISGVIEDWAAVGAAAVDRVHAQLMRNEFGLPTQTRGTLLKGDWLEGTTTRKRAPQGSGPKLSIRTAL